MEVQKVMVATPQKTQSKKEKATERVQQEYLYQIRQGKTNKQAILESLKALDDDYQPKTDCFECRETANVCGKIKLPSRETISKTLDFIVKIGPIIYELFNKLCDFIPKKQEQTEEKPIENSTTA
jgi:hypothetical protein